MKPRVCKKQKKITGCEWWSTNKVDRITIKMSDIVGNDMNLKSDLTES